MSIARKILMGYGVLLILVFIHLVYSLTSLDQMDSINEAIMTIDNPLIEHSDRLIDILLGQEFYSQRLLILKDSDSFDLLQTRFQEFDGLLQKIRSIKNPFASVQELSAKGAAFQTLLAETYGSLNAALALSKEQRELTDKKRQELIDLVKKIGLEVRKDQNLRNELSAAIGRRAFQVLLVFGIGSVFIAVGITLLFARYISSAVGQLKLSTQQTADSKFNEIRPLKSADEFGEVSRSIADMAKKIEWLEKLYLATNPLTLLPGGLAIDDTIRTRLEAGVLTALCIVDLDNFKVFNDRYGYARGNEVIQLTAKIIKTAARELGEADDFIGHIGGDDFIVVTAPERYESICKAIIKRFDEEIPVLYDPEDRQRGAIIGKNRQGAEIVYPLMTISIAVVTDQGGLIKKPHILSRRAAELKEHAKSMSGSVYVVDKRQYNIEEEDT